MVRIKFRPLFYDANKDDYVPYSEFFNLYTDDPTIPEKIKRDFIRLVENRFTRYEGDDDVANKNLLEWSNNVGHSYINLNTLECEIVNNPYVTKEFLDTQFSELVLDGVAMSYEIIQNGGRSKRRSKRRRTRRLRHRYTRT